MLKFQLVNICIATCSQDPQDCSRTQHASSVMASVDQLVLQLRNTTSFFASQALILGGDALSDSKAAMARSITAQIGSIAFLDVAGATSLNTAIQASSFDPPQKETLAKAVSTLMMSSASAATTRRSTQTLTDVQKFFTEQDWAVFNDKNASLDKKVLVMVERLWRLNLTNPSEHTIKHCVALLATVHYVDTPAPNFLHVLVGNFKQAVVTRRSVCPSPDLEYLTSYPAVPTLLSEALGKHAYPDEADPPVLRSVDGFLQTLTLVPMRSTNKGLGQNGRLQSQDMESMFMDFLQRSGVQQHCPGLVINPRPRQGTSTSPRAATLLSGSSPSLALQDGGARPALLALQDGAAAPSTPAGIPIQLASSPVPPVATMPAASALVPDLAVAHPVNPDGSPRHIPPAPTSAEDRVADGTVLGTRPTPVDTIAALEKMAAGGVATDLDAAPKGKAKGKGKAKAEGKAKGKGTTQAHENAGETDEKTTAKGKAKAKVGAKAKAAKAKAKAGAKAKAKARARPLQLGCSKCRGSPHGCGQCKNPAFQGIRYTA